MGVGHRNPAVYAGLLGTIMGATPTQAAAVSMEQLLSNSVAPYIQFACGCIAGVALTSAFVIARSAFSGEKAAREASVHEVREEHEGVAIEAASDKEAPTAAPAPVEELVAPKMPELQSVATAEASLDEEIVSRPAVQRHLAASKTPARHMAAREWEASGVIRVQEVPASKSSGPKHRADAPVAAKAATSQRSTGRGAHFAKAADQSSRGASVPADVEKPRVDASNTKPSDPVVQSAESAAHAATDYSDIAQKYVQKKTLRERMAARAAGVAGLLAERLGADPLQDVPVISRADGTVGDVGTIWWDKALGSSIRRIEDLAGEESSASSKPRISEPDVSTTFDQRAEASSRAAIISRSVAEVNVGIYPERRTADDLEHEDVWDQALKAMSERIMPRQTYPVFADAIGTIDTLDEPAGLEDATGFIPFRYHANHPEVVDTSTYVDYLIDDEFSRNPSHAARKSSRDFLTVIQGGSQKTHSMAGQEHRPKHFAASRQALAKEA